jgi:hypothetical protein
MVRMEYKCTLTFTKFMSKTVLRSLASLLPATPEGGFTRLHVMGARPRWYRSRATATGQRFFAYGKTALPFLPALRSTHPTGVRPGTDEWRFARRARSLEGETAGRGSPSAPMRSAAFNAGIFTDYRSDRTSRCGGQMSSGSANFISIHFPFLCLRRSGSHIILKFVLP